MLTIRLTNCLECASIPVLLENIDCRLNVLADVLYNNIVFQLNTPIEFRDWILLLNYRRILMYKLCNPEYAYSCKITLNDIASRVKLLTFNCKKPCFYIANTTTTTTIPPTTTTSTTLPPTTSTTTTAGIISFAHNVTAGFDAPDDNICTTPIYNVTIYSADEELELGSFVFADSQLTTPFVGLAAGVEWFGLNYTLPYPPFENGNGFIRLPEGLNYIVMIDLCTT